MYIRRTFWLSFKIPKNFYVLCLWARGPLIQSFTGLARVSKFVVENVFNNSHIEYNNECDNNDNKNDKKSY